jgi:hypothetical protein
LRSQVRSIVVAVWPGLPGLVRRHAWPTQILNLLGLAAPYSLPVVAPPAPELTNPKSLATVPPEFEDMIGRYRRGNMESFVTGKLLTLQDAGVARLISPFLQQIYAGGSLSEANLPDHIAEFRSIYLSSPIANNHGGANYATGLALFLIARHLNPSLIVESGVLRGMSSMLLRAAVPNAEIHAFDLNFSLLHRSENVEYHQCDWTTVDIKANSSALGYFDDHVNQARRVIEAHGRGFCRLVLDDSWTWGAISGCGGVPLPSIDMLMSDDLKLGDKIEWVEAGQVWTYTHDDEHAELCASARKLIKAAYDVPSLYRQTGVAPTSALKFVELI